MSERMFAATRSRAAIKGDSYWLSCYREYTSWTLEMINRQYSLRFHATRQHQQSEELKMFKIYRLIEDDVARRIASEQASVAWFIDRIEADGKGTANDKIARIASKAEGVRGGQVQQEFGSTLDIPRSVSKK